MNIKKRMSTRFMVQAAFIAAIYAALTYVFAPISFGQIQLRVSEALTVLPFFTPAAIPGLFLGCVLGNLISSIGVVDIVFGSIATLIAAFVTSKIKDRRFAPLPPVIANGVIVGFELYYVFNLPLLASMGWVALGEIISCYGLGYLLMLAIGNRGESIFKLDA